MELNFKKILLIVLDGFGIASASPGNAVTHQPMKVFNELVNQFPSLSLQAAGPNVGLPWGEPGNSEVGHMCIGAGRIVLQDLPRIDKSIADKSFYGNQALAGAIEHAKKNNSALHLIGLVGFGGVHASQLHLYSLLVMAAENGLREVYVHAITDGRDTKPDSGRDFVLELEKKMLELGVGKIASLCGRFYAMDRAKHWDLTETAYRAYVGGEGAFATSPTHAIENYYSQAIYDETIPPTLITLDNGRRRTIENNDAVIIFNFRADRAIQITQAFTDPGSVGFERKYAKLENMFIATMTEYVAGLPVSIAFPKLAVPDCLSEVLSKNGKKQFHISEAEKFPHVTYFFSNGREDPFTGEEWEQVKSSSEYKDRYQNVPQMAAFELTVALLDKLAQPYDFYLVNYANPDMVGHTGNLVASIRAVQAIDQCLDQITKYALETRDVLVLITSDHGNVEGVHEVGTGRVSTSHSTNPVPFLAVGHGLQLGKPRKNGYLHLAATVPAGLLSDVAPTILELFELPKPAEMTGISLIRNFAVQITGHKKSKRHFETSVE